MMLQYSCYQYTRLICIGADRLQINLLESGQLLVLGSPGPRVPKDQTKGPEDPGTQEPRAVPIPVN